MTDRPARSLRDTLADELRLQAWLARAELRHPSLAHPETREAIDALVLLRDELRLQAHLGRAEAADRFERAEAHWRSLQHAVDATVDDVGGRIGEALRLLWAEYRPAGHPSTVAEAMAHHPPTLRPGADADEALHVLWEEGIEAVPVVGEDGVVLGMISDRDVAMAVHVRRELPTHIPVLEITPPRRFALSASEPVRDAERRLRERGLRRSPVVDEAGHLLGVFALERDAARP